MVWSEMRMTEEGEEEDGRSWDDSIGKKKLRERRQRVIFEKE